MKRATHRSAAKTTGPGPDSGEDNGVFDHVTSYREPWYKASSHLLTPLHDIPSGPRCNVNSASPAMHIIPRRAAVLASGRSQHGKAVGRAGVDDEVDVLWFLASAMHTSAAEGGCRSAASRRSDERARDRDSCSGRHGRLRDAKVAHAR